MNAPHETSRRSQSFDEFCRVLSTRGVRDALAYVLELSAFRFIGIFRFEDGKARAVVHYDRENPQVTTTDEVPDTATYCCYVRDSKGAFATADAMLDERLTDHPARATVLSYCGVPIIEPDGTGTLLGTLCHYDLVPRDPDKLDLDLLLQVVAKLVQGGHVPAYGLGNAT